MGSEVLELPSRNPLAAHDADHARKLVLRQARAPGPACCRRIHARAHDSGPLRAKPARPADAADFPIGDRQKRLPALGDRHSESDAIRLWVTGPAGVPPDTASHIGASMKESTGRDDGAGAPQSRIHRGWEHTESDDRSSTSTQHFDANTNGGRTLDDMANEYSRRAREARAKQGKPPVISDPGVLNRIAELMALDEPTRRSLGQPAA